MATFLTSLKIGTLKEKTAVATFGVALETLGNFKFQNLVTLVTASTASE